MAYFGNQEEAFKLFTKAIKIAPDLASAHENLALIYYYRKQYDLAVKHCRAAIKLGYSVNPEFLKLLEPYQNSGVRE